jgi:hypothetical protein
MSKAKDIGSQGFLDAPKFQAAIDHLVTSNFLRKGNFKDVTEIQIAQNMITAERMLWYFQLKDWIEKGELVGEGGSKFIGAIIHQGALNLKSVVDTGYHEKNGWWSLNSVTDDKKAQAVMVMEIWAFGNFINMARVKTKLVISVWFDVVIGYVTRPDWISASRQMARDAKFAQMPKSVAIRKCIQPMCDNQVDIRERRSGACCKAHMRYKCAKCGHTHSWLAKIGKQHFVAGYAESDA